MLVSRDEQSCLVVSYKEIKQCIESAFRFVFLLMGLCCFYLWLMIVIWQMHKGQ